MKIGPQRDRVTLQRRTSTNDGGAQTVTYTAVSPERVPASVLESAGQRMERVFGSQVTATATHLVTLRAWDAVRLSDRFVWHTRTGDRYLEITGKASAEGPMRRVLVLACEERDAA